MTETNAEYIAFTPGFAKPAVGDVVKVEAVDWGMVDRQVAATDTVHRIVRGTVYGQVIICTDEQMTIAPQVFDDSSVRCALTMPWVTVQTVTILEKAQP